jgi:hypothetical protein
MKNLIFLFVFMILATFARTQNANEEQQQPWDVNGFLSQQFSQASFTNWAAGGQNSLSSISIASFNANYQQDIYLWENRLEMAYGLIKTENTPLRKNEDKIDLLSRIGRNLNENLLLSAKLNLRTQFAAGYDYANDAELVSRFMSPGFLIVAVGLDYRPVEDFSIFLSPASGKFTFVLDDELAQQGAFGVAPGENIRSEFGALLSLILAREMAENVKVNSKLDLFYNLSDPHKRSRGHVDVQWETGINLKINRFLTSSLLFHLIYDHDIPIPIYETINGEQVQVGTGPRTQFKQTFGLGFSLAF